MLASKESPRPPGSIVSAPLFLLLLVQSVIAWSVNVRGGGTRSAWPSH